MHYTHPLGWPSVTECLATYDLRWYKYFIRKHGTVEKAEQYARERAESGSRLHKAAEVVLAKRSIEEAITEVSREEESAVKILKWHTDLLGVEVLGSERRVENNEYKYHGTLDGLLRIQNVSMLPNEDYWGNVVAVNPGVLTIGDLKTKVNDKKLTDGEMKKHAMQMAAYGGAIAEETGNWPELGLIWQLDIKTNKITPVCVYPLQKWFKAFLLQRQNYDLINNKGEWETKKKKSRCL